MYEWVWVCVCVYVCIDDGVDNVRQQKLTLVVTFILCVFFIIIVAFFPFYISLFVYIDACFHVVRQLLVSFLFIPDCSIKLNYPFS